MVRFIIKADVVEAHKKMYLHSTMVRFIIYKIYEEGISSFGDLHSTMVRFIIYSSASFI